MIDYRKLQPGDAGKLVDLVQSTYGDSYINSLFYDKDQIHNAVEEARLISSVAFDEHEKLIGHVGMYWDRLDSKTPDPVAAIVRERYQRQGVLAQLTQRMGALIQGREIVGLHSYAVTTHTGSQKNGIQNGSIETGFLFPEFPSSMQASGVDIQVASERYPALALYSAMIKPEQRNCYVIPEYGELLSQIYTRVDYDRAIQHAVPVREYGTSEFVLHRDERKFLDRIEIRQIGNDWRQATQSFRQGAISSNANSGFYIDIPLSQPLAIEMMQELREEGWCFGCILFERNNGDYLRMQFSNMVIDYDAIHLLTDTANYLKNAVLNERASVRPSDYSR